MDSKSKLEKFLTWFQSLNEADQEELMQLVYSEHKIKDVVRTFSTMPQNQRQVVFQRLGLPNDLLSKIPPTGANATEEIEVEWQEWDNKKP